MPIAPDPAKPPRVQISCSWLAKEQLKKAYTDKETKKQRLKFSFVAVNGSAITYIVTFCDTETYRQFVSGIADPRSFTELPPE